MDQVAGRENRFSGAGAELRCKRAQAAAKDFRDPAQIPGDFV